MISAFSISITMTVRLLKELGAQVARRQDTAFGYTLSHRLRILKKQLFLKF